MDAPPRGRTSRLLPLVLLGLLMVLLVGFVITQADVHGRTYDEPLQNDFGHRVLAWYASGGSDTSFLDYASSKQMPQHGPAFETGVALVQRVAGQVAGADPWRVRSLVTGATGVLGILLVALCGIELSGAWVGLTAAVGLTLYPRYTGAIFNNSKDVPLAVAMLLVLWLTLRMMRRWRAAGRWRRLDPLLVGLALGAAVAVRVNAGIWYAILGLLGLAWLVHCWSDVAPGRPSWRVELRRVVLAGVTVGVSSYVALLALWPYVFLNPLGGLPDSLASMSRYQYAHAVLFEGRFVPAMQLPRSYSLVWLWQGSPAPTILLAAGGALLVAVSLVRRRAHAGWVVVLAAGVLPLLAIVVLRPTLYNGLRHFLFVVPPLVLLAALALASLVRVVARRSRAAGAVVVALALVSQVWVLVGVARLYPDEYMYFNQASGGFRQQYDQFETDYWGVCSRDAALWLNTHWRDYTSAPTATVRNLRAPGALLDLYLEPGIRSVPLSKRSDFSVQPVRHHRRDLLPGYRAVHDVDVDGIPVCRIQVRPGARA